ncbi:hypothetical protein NIES4072_61030 [Nostoc commune NIES-4072]|uniref:Uncharacterized protein n=1 Tax=Nostoc commune NIES-4072 TaxID=2005467 RepID=A0A2R5FVR8_NOSCO|nr:hypothetical protein NIES4070_29930 [Nostoc commune HK-02]GBG22395.1 hypothetical protein NIES4072_61030 [Nostoc commune NIES-4072]
MSSLKQFLPVVTAIPLSLLGLTHTLRILGALGVLAVREIKLFSNFCVSPNFFSLLTRNLSLQKFY